jgi:hypothetical protein
MVRELLLKVSWAWLAVVETTVFRSAFIANFY